MEPSEPGDGDEVVVVHELLPAEVPEVADPAVVTGPGVGLDAAVPVERGEEPLPRAPEEGAELGRPERLPLARPQLDVHVLGQPALDPPELLGVEAELEEVERLGRARELRVHGLVCAVGLLLLEEVGEAAPGAVREVRLVDDVGLAGANRVLGVAASLPRRTPRRRR